MRHGRSLVRTLDASVIVIMTIAIALLCFLAWAMRVTDRNAFDVESTIVQRELSQGITEFRTNLPDSPAEYRRWIEGRPHERAIHGEGGLLMRPAGEVTHIGRLASDPATLARLEEARQALPRLDPRRVRVDFLLLGPRGGESLALMAQLPPIDGKPVLALTLVDSAALATGLEAVSISLRPSLASDGPGRQDGSLMLSGFGGNVIAVLSWNSPRISTVVYTYIMPLLAVLLIVGLWVLMMIRHYWTQARDGFVNDIKTVEAIAYTDALTGLPNRRALFEHLRKHGAPEDERQAITVLMLDLDGFKWVNDQISHQAGDLVLEKAAEVFRACLGGNAYVARLGGDEFVAILPGAMEDEALAALHAELTDSLRERISPDGSIQIGVSMGAASSARYPVCGENLLKLADLAVYAAKAAGRGVALAYHPGMKQEKAYRRQIERDLRKALRAEGLTVAHQPVVDALTSEVLGYETLVRWLHPERGYVSPSEFIPIAEQSDLIIEIGAFVLDRALSELGGAGDCRISVNATGRQLLSPDFVDTVQRLLARHNVAPSRLCLELTETSLITEQDRVIDVMNDLKALGVRFAIDDFGVGYSSLNYLLRFKFDVLKIDRDFIAGLDDKPEAPMIVTSIVSLARSLRMQVVGEGIETAAQQRFLASAGCNALQGFLFGRPLPADQLSLAGRRNSSSFAPGFQVA